MSRKLVQQYFSVREVANLLDCSRSTVYRYIDKGLIEALPIGSTGNIRISQQALQAHIRGRKKSLTFVETLKWARSAVANIESFAYEDDCSDNRYEKIMNFVDAYDDLARGFLEKAS